MTSSHIFKFEPKSCEILRYNKKARCRSVQYITTVNIFLNLNQNHVKCYVRTRKHDVGVSNTSLDDINKNFSKCQKFENWQITPAIKGKKCFKITVNKHLWGYSFYSFFNLFISIFNLHKFSCFSLISIFNFLMIFIHYNLYWFILDCHLLFN